MAERRFVDVDISSYFGVPMLRARCFNQAALAAVRGVCEDASLSTDEKKARLKSIDPSTVRFERAVPAVAAAIDSGVGQAAQQQRAEQTRPSQQQGHQEGWVAFGDSAAPKPARPAPPAPAPATGASPDTQRPDSALKQLENLCMPAPLRQAEAERLLVVAAAGLTVLAAGGSGLPRLWRLGENWTSTGAPWTMPVPKGEKDTEPYRTFKAPDVNCPAATCMHVLGGTLWSGHADGTIRAWKPGGGASEAGIAGICTLRWRAHRSAVVSMTLTNDGTLWTGSTSGGMRMWQFGKEVPPDVKVATQSQWGSFSPHSEPMETDGSFGADLRVPISVAASASGNLHSRVRFVAQAGDVVWSGGNANLGLWDARSGRLIRRVGYDFLDEAGNVLEGATVDADDAKMAALEGSAGARSKAKGIGSAFRSMGKLARVAANKASAGVTKVVSSAADYASGPGGTSDYVTRGRGQLHCLCVAPVDGGAWAGYATGVVTHWGRSGKVLIETRLANTKVPVRAITAVGGARLWAGTADGYIHVLGAVGSQRGKPIGKWLAHDSPVISLASDGPTVVSMAADGAVRVWNARSPSPGDATARDTYAGELAAVSQEKTYRIFAGTWNVNEKQAKADDIARWLCGKGNSTGNATAAQLTLDFDVVAVGFQEIEMGGGSLVSAAAKNAVGNSKLSKDAQWWCDNMTLAVQEATRGVPLSESFELVSFRQMAGIACGVWARRRLREVVGDAQTCTVACGALGNTLGNKGAAAVRFTLHRQSLAFISSHFAAHQKNVADRNANYARIASNLDFTSDFFKSSMNFAAVASAASSRTFESADSSSSIEDSSGESGRDDEGLESDANAPVSRSESVGAMALQQSSRFADAADVIVWYGDFNYRIDLPNEEVRPAIQRGDLGVLRGHDQLMREQAAGRAFRRMREAQIEFPPTYKFDKGYGSQSYDTSEKCRIPAWTDRVLVFDHRATRNPGACTTVDVVRYEAEMDAFGSDHRPVRAELAVRMAVAEARLGRACAIKAYGACAAVLNVGGLGQPGSGKGAMIRAEADKVAVRMMGGDTTLRIANMSKQGLLFRVQGADQGAPLQSMPSWLTVEPGAGALAPGAVLVLKFSVHPDSPPPTGSRASVAIRAIGEYGMRAAPDEHETAAVVSVSVE
eukprot:PRCOL_00001087-RA